jgi:sucrose phosphorylase
MKNQVQLVTYVDRLSGGTICDLQALLDGALRGVFGGVHLLPFFDPIDGADAGFDPSDHTAVDSRLGDWSDIKRLTGGIEVMADVIVNHVSANSPQFRDFLARGAASAYAGMFLTREAVFGGSASDAELAKVYRPRPGQPFTKVKLASGEERTLWTTFTPQQIDIDVQHPQGRAYLARILEVFAANGIRMVRLDAVGYAIKKAGTSCFMLPETFSFIDQFAAQARALGIEVLVEIHSYYRKQIEIAGRVDWVYDFALPPLVLHSCAFRTAKCLKEWIRIRPRNALTVLDTHDGIGIIDIGADASDRNAPNSIGWWRSSTSVPAARVGAPPAPRPRTLISTRSTALSTTRWAVTIAPICWRAPSSSSCPARRRSTTSGCWPVTMTWPCWRAVAWGATSTGTTTTAPRLRPICSGRWCARCSS